MSNKKISDSIRDDDVILNKSWLDEVILPENYQLSEKDEYMNDYQLKYFYNKLIDWRKYLLQESNQTLKELQDKKMQEPDESDRAFSEFNTNIELKTRERYLKLIAKINSTLEKIKNKTYGFCEETGEMIGLKRLDARPIATLTVLAQEQRERKERLMKKEEPED